MTDDTTNTTNGAMAPARDERGHWLPGRSGNPGGRPRSQARLRELAGERTESALATLTRIMEDERAPCAARVSAACALLDRAYGKPVQSTALTDADGKSSWSYDPTKTTWQELWRRMCWVMRQAADEAATETPQALNGGADRDH